LVDALRTMMISGAQSVEGLVFVRKVKITSKPISRLSYKKVLI
jgi:hypothetical protein